MVAQRASVPQALRYPQTMAAHWRTGAWGPASLPDCTHDHALRGAPMGTPGCQRRSKGARAVGAPGGRAVLAISVTPSQICFRNSGGRSPCSPLCDLSVSPWNLCDCPHGATGRLTSPDRKRMEVRCIVNRQRYRRPAPPVTCDRSIRCARIVPLGRHSTGSFGALKEPSSAH
jgi:hypothetical protein